MSAATVDSSDFNDAIGALDSSELDACFVLNRSIEEKCNPCDG